MDFSMYLLRVRSVLKSEQDEDQLTPSEVQLCRNSQVWNVEPGVCAEQIIANRAALICGAVQ